MLSTSNAAAQDLQEKVFNNPLQYIFRAVLHLSILACPVLTKEGTLYYPLYKLF